MFSQVVWSGRGFNPPFRDNLLVPVYAAVQVQLTEQGHIKRNEGQVVATLVDALGVDFPAFDRYAEGAEQVFFSKSPGAHTCCSCKDSRQNMGVPGAVLVFCAGISNQWTIQYCPDPVGRIHGQRVVSLVTCLFQS